MNTRNPRRNAGRPSKGDRRYVNTPVHKAYADKLERYSDLTGEPMGVTVAKIFEAHIDDLGLEALEAGADQQSLDLMDDAQKTA